MSNYQKRHYEDVANIFRAHVCHNDNRPHGPVSISREQQIEDLDESLQTIKSLHQMLNTHSHNTQEGQKMRSFLGNKIETAQRAYELIEEELKK